MKLKTDNGKDSFDMKQEQRKNKWAKRILDNLSVKIPLMTSIAKNTQSAHFNFIGIGRHASLAESLIFKSNRFRTTSEVYRAAMYIGMTLLYHMIKEEGTLKQQARADQIYKTIETMESLNHSRQIIDAVVLAAKDVIECAVSGVIDYEEMDDKVDTLVDALPKELRAVAREKINRVKKGDSIIDIAETKLQRGLKGKKRRVNS